MSFKNLGELLSKIGKNTPTANYFGKGHEVFDFIYFIQNWHIVVGEKLSTNTLPLKIKNKTLFIITSHSIYSSQLQFLENQLLMKIHKSFPGLKNSVSRLNFKASQYFMDIKESQQQQIENQQGQVQEVPKKENNKFNPSYLKARSDAKKVIGDIEDKDLEEALLDFNIKFTSPKN